jgi:hypothetical protein
MLTNYFCWFKKWVIPAVVVVIAWHVACYDFQATVRRVRGSLALFTIGVTNVVGIVFVKLELNWIKKKNLWADCKLKLC